MTMFVRMSMIMVMAMLMSVRKVYVKLHPGDALPLLSANVQVVTVQLEFTQFAFEFACVHAQVYQRAIEHVTADAAKDIEIQSSHLTVDRVLALDLGGWELEPGFPASALIWLAA
jgi:hypothetical protein